MPVYAERKGLELSCFFEPSQVVEAKGVPFLRLNYEGFFFCKPEEKQLFEGDPLRYCGLLTDPVSKLRFRPDESSPRQEHEGITYYFEGPRTARIFSEAPEDHMLPGYEMEPDPAQEPLVRGHEHGSEESS